MIKINDEVLEFDKFPNGEIKFPLITNFGYCDIFFKFESNYEIFLLTMLKHHLDSCDTEVDLIMPYVPYSRMDRVYDDTQVFSLKWFCKLINDLNFNHVHIAEPHSDVVTALIDRVSVMNFGTKWVFNHALHRQKLSFDRDVDVICFPDAGAQKRYSSQFNGFKTVVQNKVRDFDTGNIIKAQIIGDMSTVSNVVIVDDLCSYGGTFIRAGNELKQYTDGNIYLVVTHCETSILKGKVFEQDSPISKVFTTNSIISSEFANEKLDITNII